MLEYCIGNYYLDYYFLRLQKQCLKSNKYIMNLQFKIEHENSSISDQGLSHISCQASNFEYSPILKEFYKSQHDSISFLNSLLLYSSQEQNNPACQSTNKQNTSQTKSSQRTMKKQKNNNSIKKIGRLILDHIKQYSLKGKTNLALTNMLRMLSRNSRLGRTEKNKRDKFNTHHLAQLFNDKSQDVKFFNLLTTRRILCRFLRSNVKDSYQIKESSKLVYLNTLKCTALRCCNSKLAVRLQMTS